LNSILLFFFLFNASAQMMLSDVARYLGKMMNAALNSCLRVNTGFQFLKIEIFFHYQSNYLHGQKFDVHVYIKLLPIATFSAFRYKELWRIVR